jgi:inositol-phosphate phosphatase/L-galactose 1-phosphate phosphatase/histidinol-phosphatase
MSSSSPDLSPIAQALADAAAAQSMHYFRTP